MSDTKTDAVARQRTAEITGLLRQAAALVAKAKQKLDVTKMEPCKTCGAKRFENITQARVFGQIERTDHTLLDAAQKLEA